MSSRGIGCLHLLIGVIGVIGPGCLVTSIREYVHGKVDRLLDGVVGSHGTGCYSGGVRPKLVVLMR